MSDDGRGLMLDFVEAHFADEDAKRNAWLEDALRRDPIVGDLCHRGHDNWGRKASGARYCRTCNAMREDERRQRAARLAGRGQ